MYEYHCKAKGHVTKAEHQPEKCWCGCTRFWHVEAGWPAHFKEVWEKSNEEALRLIANQSEETPYREY